MIRAIKNFEWDCTENKLTIFIPCYKNIDTVRFVIYRISTILEPWEYTIIIGNDGFHHDWNDLTECMIHRDHPIPVKYFSLMHDECQPRNSGFIRNYAMKRCRSKYYMQKDCSVALDGDFPLYALETCNKEYLWRPGNICVLNKKDSNKCIKNKSFSDLGTSFQKRIEPVTCTNVEKLKNHLMVMSGQVNFTTFFQYAFCANTKFLQGIHGYDEDYTSYGYEDTDMFCRLLALGKIFKPDYRTFAYHLWHPQIINEQQLKSMIEIFESKNPEHSIRNLNGWGEGK